MHRLPPHRETRRTYFSTDPVYLSETRDWLLDPRSEPRSWAYEAYLAVEDDPRIAGIYHAQNDGLMRRVTFLSMVDYALLILGIIAGVYCLIRRKKQIPPVPLITRSWSASSIIGVFFAANLILFPWIIFIGYMYPIYETMVGSWAAYYIYESLWRAFPAVVFMILFLRTPRNMWETFGLGKPVHVPLLFAALAMVSIAQYALFFLSPEAEIDPTDFLDQAYADTPYMLYTIFVSVILAPIFEEIVFRGFLFQGLRAKIGTVWAGVVSTVLFALIHVQYDLWGWVAVAITGMAAAFLVWRTGSLKTAIVLHALTNLLITWHVYVQYQKPL